MIEDLPGVDARTAAILLRFSGIRGLAKSLRVSMSEDVSLGSFVCASGATIDIDSSASLDIDSRLLFGLDTATYVSNKRGKSVLHLGNGASFSVTGPDHCAIQNGAYVYVDGRFSIGSSYIGNFTRIHCLEEITIGDDCSISWEVDFLDDDFHALDSGRGFESRSAPITVGDHVWIGSRSTILKGVSIGDGAVVSAGAVVVDDVPERTLVGGVPAEVIRDDIAWK